MRLFSDQWFWVIALLWSLLCGGLLALSIYQERVGMLEDARIEVRAYFAKDLIYRKWVAIHGGVYAPITAESPPNPYLADIPERDLTTPSGRKLTLINPAYMFRQASELGAREYGVLSHITSLNPIRPQNAPDHWERDALQRFERGEKEVSGIDDDLNGTPHMRLMRPLLVDQPCLKCHAQQGYKLGQIRGGISNSAPLAPHLAVARAHISVLAVGFLLLWGCGLGFILFVWRKFRQNISRHEELQQRLAKLSQAIEQAGEAVLITDHAGRIEYINPAFTKLTGYTSGEILGKNPSILKSGKQDHAFYDEMWRHISSGHIWQGTLMDRKKSGVLYPASMSISPVRSEAGEISHYIAIQQDNTARDELEYRFRQAQKMEALGTLVGGISHDFNNMLAGVLGNIFLARQAATDRPDIDEKLEKAENLGFTAADMVAKLLAFARKGVVVRQHFSLTTLLKESCRLLEVSVPENIRLQTNFCKESLTIHGDATQLQQMLMNLVMNARDALAERPTPVITVTLELASPDEHLLRKHPQLPDAPCAHLTVGDNGIGIPPENREAIFEPFFTTKGPGKGTGLGLAMSYGAVNSHGGVITVESETDVGTIFNIWLPISENDEEVAQKGNDAELHAGTDQTILLIDDDANVLEIGRALLERLGYRVVASNDSREALPLFRQHRATVALAVLDLVMPNIGGYEVAAQLRAEVAELPILFITGYDLEHHEDGGDHLPPNCIILSKPFRAQELSQAIKRLIG